MFSLSFIRSGAVALASSAAIALVLASTMAVADGVDSDHDGVGDDLEDSTERTVAASASGDEFNVSSHLGTGALQDQFELWYRAGHFGVGYSQREGASSSYRIELRNLIEWIDADQDGRIDDGEILPSTPLGSSAFHGQNVTRSERIDPDGGRVFDFLVRSQDRQVTLDVTIAQRFMRLDGVILTPMEAKMDITMTPVVRHPGASVGLEFRMETEDQVHFEDRSWDELKGFAPSERAVNVTGTEGERSASVFFSWANSAVTPDGSIPVGLTSQSSNSDEYSLYFAYPMGTSQTNPTLVHHTTLGIQSVVYDIVEKTAPEIRGDLTLYTGAFAAVAVLVGLTIFFGNRRKQKRDGEGGKP